MNRRPPVKYVLKHLTDTKYIKIVELMFSKIMNKDAMK